MDQKGKVGEASRRKRGYVRNDGMVNRARVVAAHQAVGLCRVLSCLQVICNGYDGKQDQQENCES